MSSAKKDEYTKKWRSRNRLEEANLHLYQSYLIILWIKCWKKYQNVILSVQIAIGLGVLSVEILERIMVRKGG